LSYSFFVYTHVCNFSGYMNTNILVEIQIYKCKVRAQK
jgi:hypothetical protein